MRAGFAFAEEAEDVFVDGFCEEEHGDVDGAAEWNEEENVPVLHEVVGRRDQKFNGGAHRERRDRNLGEVFE